MIAIFYRKYSAALLWMVVLSSPLLYLSASALPTNNDLDTWLPRKSGVRADYDRFKRDFGAEDAILIGLSEQEPDSPLTEALCRRIEGLEGVRKCWSPSRLQEVMAELGVSEEEARRRMTGFLVGEEGRLTGLVALFSEEGLKERSATVARIREQLDYCQFSAPEVAVAGAPVVVAELDRLGSRRNNKRFFMITLLLSFGLLYSTLRDWKLSAGILVLTVWAINLTLTAINVAGGEMNFILGAMSVMVMVFTIAVSIHFLHYYRGSLDQPDPLTAAMRLAWKPCLLATLTTTIGLLSLAVSDIGPVQQFGVSAAIGSVVALVAGLGLTPALLTIFPLAQTLHHVPGGDRVSRIACWLIEHKRSVATATCVLVLATCFGLRHLSSRINALEFLPPDNRVLLDVNRIEQELTSTTSIEAVVDLSGVERPFVEKLEEIRRIEADIRRHPSVRHTLSAASFFPTAMPGDPLEAAALLNRAQARRDQADFVADGDRLWRISVRLGPGAITDRQEILHELRQRTAGHEIVFTGIAPLLDSAQQAIFYGFWESFAMAFGIISLIMIVSLRSLKVGSVAMIPNLTPLCIVFGTLGWLEVPVDIGMMMTASIALGIAVDGTFHFLIRYEDHYRRTRDSANAARKALLLTGTPICKAAVITAVGMLALATSNFPPTSRFGWMMATLLMAALIGDLVLLPAVLALRPGAGTVRAKQEESVRERPHFLTHIWSTKESMIHLSDEAEA